MIESLLDSPFFGVSLCFVTFCLGRWVQKKTGWMLANPLIIAMSVCVFLLLILRIPYEAFAGGADFLGAMLGPVTALLGLGIYNQRKILKAYFLPVLLGCTAGSIVSMISVLLLCRLFDLDTAITAAMLPKSCTTPIAIGIAESHGGLVAVAPVSVIVSGLTGGLCAPMWCRWFRITDPVAQGLAVGASSHVLGTPKAREMGELQGAMSSIAIGVCGLISVIISLFLPL